MSTIQSTAANTRNTVSYSWRVVDIVIAAVVAVASGIIFWAWGLFVAPVAGALFLFEPLSGLIGGGWLFAGVLGGLIVRKPGAAIFTEIVAALVSMMIGTQWGFLVLVSGLIQGLGAEIVFAAFRYRKWTLPIALLAGAGTGLAMGINDVILSYAAWEFPWKLVYIASGIVSGVIIAGLGSWLLVGALAKTGALSRFAAGRESQRGAEI